MEVMILLTVVVLAVILYLIRRGGVAAALTVEVPKWVGSLVVGIGMAVPFLGVGIGMVCMGVPIIATGLLDRASIRTSIFDLPVHGPVGSSAGAVGFLVAGLLCLVGAFWPWRWWK